MDNDQEARLARLEARADISEVLFRYARACDRADRAMMADCFWPESKHRHGRFDGLSRDFLDYAFNIINSMKFAAHHISNVSIEARGDRAFSECYFIAHHRQAVPDAPDKEQDVIYEGRYLDYHERRGGVWKIIERYGTSDFVS